MKTLLPFKLTSIPIKKLALINFEKNPDKIYRGLELQLLDGPPYGTGWRIIAYRNDNYVDVYDDNALTTIEDERFDVVEKGLKNYSKTAITGVILDKDYNGVHICFYFKDIINRDISVEIHESSKRNSKAMNLLAPVGSGSVNPASLPLFFLYDFDFLRKHKTDVKVFIDGHMKTLDNFPFPITKELQWRYYTRYSLDCHMIEFAKAEAENLQQVDLDEEFIYTEEQTRYYFEVKNGDASLKRISLDNKVHKVEVTFDQPMPITNKNDGVVNGQIYINTYDAMGSVNGSYTWEQNDGNSRITISPDAGWTSVPNSFITRIILGPKSIFCTWPKLYHYEQKIQLDTNFSISNWKNEKYN